MTKQSAYLCLAIVAMLCAVPALWFGMLAAVAIDYFPAFPVPAAVLVAIGCACIRRAESC